MSTGKDDKKAPTGVTTAGQPSAKAFVEITVPDEPVHPTMEMERVQVVDPRHSPTLPRIELRKGSGPRAPEQRTRSEPRGNNVVPLERPATKMQPIRIDPDMLMDLSRQAVEKATRPNAPTTRAAPTTSMADPAAAPRMPVTDPAAAPHTPSASKSDPTVARTPSAPRSDPTAARTPSASRSDPATAPRAMETAATESADDVTQDRVTHERITRERVTHERVTLPMRSEAKSPKGSPWAVEGAAAPIPVGELPSALGPSARSEASPASEQRGGAPPPSGRLLRVMVPLAVVAVLAFVVLQVLPKAAPADGGKAVPVPSAMLGVVPTAPVPDVGSTSGASATAAPVGAAPPSDTVEVDAGALPPPSPPGPGPARSKVREDDLHDAAPPRAVKTVEQPAPTIAPVEQPAPSVAPVIAPPVPAMKMTAAPSTPPPQAPRPASSGRILGSDE